jgi:hypothetical protein
LLFLHADTVLEHGWQREVGSFIERIDRGEQPDCAAAFRFALDDLGPQPRMLERMVSWRCALFRLPYGDQGLLMPKRLYDELGGFGSMPLMEDVDLALCGGLAGVASSCCGRALSQARCAIVATGTCCAPRAICCAWPCTICACRLGSYTGCMGEHAINFT